MKSSFERTMRAVSGLIQARFRELAQSAARHIAARKQAELAIHRA